MIPASLAGASCVSLCFGDLKRKDSWLLAADSVSGLVTSLCARSRSTSGLVANKAWASEALLCLVEGGADVADRDCDEFQFIP